MPAVWVIRDGAREISTGCAPGSVAEAGEKLHEYLGRKGTAAAAQSGSDPAQVLIAEVLAFYATDKAPKLANPEKARSFMGHLAAWWAGKSLADIRRSNCEAYVAHRMTQPHASYKDPEAAPRVSDQAARRELEDLSAAITFWHEEYPLTRVPKVWLPPKREGSREALTRSEAAALLWAAMGWQKAEAYGPAAPGAPWPTRWLRQTDPARGHIWRTTRTNRRHLRRFILMGLYTGTRPGVLPKLLWDESPTQAWVGLDDGVIYRRGREEREHRTKRRPLVRMPDRLLAHMRRWKRLDDQARAALPEGKSMANTVIRHGGDALAGRIRTGFEGCVRDAGLDSNITPHWLRHTCATWLMEAEVPIWDAAGFTGMSTKVLEDRYGHQRPSHQSRARKALR